MRLWILGLVVIAALAIIGTAEADVVVDDNNGTWADYGTIGEALADVGSGEYINVYAGTYNENLVVNKTVSIWGNSSSTVIVNGGSGFVTFNVSAANVTLGNMNITSSSFGIHLQWANDSAVYQCMVTDNYRIGIYINDSKRVGVVGCNVSHNGDGIFIRNSTHVEVNESSICRNMRGGGTWNDGIRFDSLVENSTIWGNDIYRNEYGIDLDDPYNNEHYWDILFSNNTIVGSSSNNIFVDKLNRSVFNHNYVIKSGSYGVSISNSRVLSFGWNNIRYCTNYGLQSMDCRNVTFENNSVFYNYGSGVNLIRDDNWSIVRNEFRGNDDYGLRINSPKVNYVYYNNFKENNGVGVQGYNADVASVWDDGVSEGNYWHNSTADPYEMDGNADAEDRYPLSKPVGTSAPEKVAEFGLLLAVSIVAFMAIAIRRKRR